MSDNLSFMMCLASAIFHGCSVHSNPQTAHMWLFSRWGTILSGSEIKVLISSLEKLFVCVVLSDPGPESQSYFQYLRYQALHSKIQLLIPKGARQISTGRTQWQWQWQWNIKEKFNCNRKASTGAGLAPKKKQESKLIAEKDRIILFLF